MTKLVYTPLLYKNFIVKGRAKLSYSFNLPGLKGAATLCNLSCNLSRNYVAKQIAPKIAKCKIPSNNKFMQHFCLKKLLFKLFVMIAATL